MTVGALVLCLAAAGSLASPDEVAAALARLGDGDLVVMSDPAAARPVRVLVATKAAASVERIREVLAAPAAYGKAMPSFRRVDVLGKRERGAGLVDFQIGWELEVPLWNLRGKLWMSARTDGVDLELVEGDFSPGQFQLRVRKARSGKNEQSIVSVEGFANVRNANVATRQLTRRSPLAEPAMTVAAAYVLLKALTSFAVQGSYGRPNTSMSAPDAFSLNGDACAKAAGPLLSQHRIVAAVRNRADGRLVQVEAAIRPSAAAPKVKTVSLDPKTFASLPGWRKIVAGLDKPAACTDVSSTCWKIDTNLPLFSLDGTWKIKPQPWRASMVAGDCAGAVMGLDSFPAGSTQTTVVLSEHPRLDRAGYVPRKLIAAEPLLEQGLALALTLVQAISLAPALEKR